jgi:hypothetical protein
MSAVGSHPTSQRARRRGGTRMRGLKCEGAAYFFFTVRALRIGFNGESIRMVSTDTRKNSQLTDLSDVKFRVEPAQELSRRL